MKIEATTHSQSRTANHITLSVGRKGGIVVDKELRDSSKNPIANKAVSQAVDEINERISPLEDLPLVPGTGVDTVVQTVGGSNQSNTAESPGAIALGGGNKVSAPYSVVEGLNNTLDSNKVGNHVEGSENNATNVELSHIEGERNVVRTGKGIHVEGGNNEVTDNYTHAEGYNNKVAGVGSHAEGLGNEIDKNSIGAHAEGTINQMIGAGYAHVEGYNNIAKAAQSHTEGSGNENRGFAAHVGGVGNIVSGEAAFAHGRGLKVEGADQVAVGRYNAPKDEAIFSVGAGTSDTERKTPFYVDKNGNTWIKDFDEANPVEVNLQQVLAKSADDDAKASQKIAETNTRLTTAEKNISDNKTEANLKFAEVEEALENKAQVDERYPKLTAGFADNLVGRGEATPEKFVFQPTANDVSVQDGTARIKSIKGNSVVWNQMSTMPNITPNILADYFEIFSIPTEAKNHRYFIAFADPNLCANSIRIVGRSEADVYTEYTIPYTSHAEAIFNISPHNGRIYVRAIANAGVTKGQFDGLLFVDLTKAFPNDWQNINTVDEFYARIPSGVDIHAYNEGEIINLNTEAIKTVGFNQWDEQWERGYIVSTTGALADSDNVIRTKNFIQVISNAEYYYQVPDYVSPGNCHFYGYDADLAFVQTMWSTGGRVTKIPQNIKYIKATAGTSTSPVTTYNHDICINLSNTGRRNGEYEPYQTFTRELGIIKKYFPEGVRKAGSVADSIEWDSTKQKWVAVQRIGEVDLGGLSWVLEGNSYTIQASEIGAAIPSQANLPNIITPAPMKAISVNNATAVVNSLEAYINPTNRKLQWFANRDLYPNVASLKSAMQGVMLNYELAEPIVTEIEDIPELDYLVWDFGTEEALSSVPSAPFSADIIYQFNAVDRIRENTLRVQALENIIAQMQAQMASMAQTTQVTNEEV